MVLGVGRSTVIESVDVDHDRGAEVIVVSVRPRRATKRRCGRCGTRAPGYDRGEGRRRWRALDVGLLRCFLESDSPRVTCPVHGPTVAQVPWARHDVAIAGRSTPIAPLPRDTSLCRRRSNTSTAAR